MGQSKPHHNPVDIRRNDPSALPRFAALNAQWIQEMHFLEESDKKMIAHPEAYIQNGNHVFSAHMDGEAAGVCALKKDAGGQYELTKMAVDSNFRGHGIGLTLMDAVEHYAKQSLKVSRLYLLSNTRNDAAIRLYRRCGWVVNHEGPHPDYARANIGMEKTL